jgi:hypothetical protein
VNRYEVAVYSNAVVKNIYRVSATSRVEALDQVRGGTVECQSQEVYGEEETDVEIELIEEAK